MDGKPLLPSPAQEAENFARDGLLSIASVLLPATAKALLCHVTHVLEAHALLQHQRHLSSRRLDLSARLCSIFGAAATPALLAYTLHRHCPSSPADAPAIDFDAVVDTMATAMDTLSDAEISAGCGDTGETAAESEPPSSPAPGEQFGNVNTPAHRCDLTLDIREPRVRAALREVLPRVRATVDAAVGCGSRLVELSALVSDPGSAAQPLHADTLWTYRPEIVTCFVVLQDVDGDMGPTLMMPESHAGPAFWQRAVREGAGRRLLDDALFVETEFGTPVVKACTGERGDCVLMDSRLLHCGGGNISEFSVEEGGRRVLLYFSFRRAIRGLDRVGGEAGPLMMSLTNTSSSALAARLLALTPTEVAREQRGLWTALRKITKSPPLSLHQQMVLQSNYNEKEVGEGQGRDEGTPPCWWVQNGGETAVSEKTMTCLNAFEARMGSTLSLRVELEGKYSLEGLLEDLDGGIVQ